MKYLFGMLLLLPLAGQAMAQTPATTAATENQAFPTQLQLRVPQAPTAFNCNGKTCLVYELHLTNFTTAPMTLSRIEVLDADHAGAKPIATFSAEELATMSQPLGKAADPKQIGAGGTDIVYMWIALDSAAPVPSRLVHRAVLMNATATGAIVGTHATVLHMLYPPLQGAGWTADDGPGNSPDNHHRRGLVVIGGNAVDSRRYAVDWLKARDNADFAGNAKDVHTYFAYGQPVVAVANAKVIVARDGLPDNVPGHNEAFPPAVPLPLDTIGGNNTILDLGDSQYAYYFHLAPGSVRVKVGDHVKAGQVMARVGASGDAREPHLHFELTTSPVAMAGEGLPYVFSRYSLETPGGAKAEQNSLPLDNMVVDFGPR